MTKGQDAWQIPWRLFLSELVGTAALLLGGLSIVIFMFGAGSPMEGLLPSVKIRQMTTGFLFGCVGSQKDHRALWCRLPGCAATGHGEGGSNGTLKSQIRSGIAATRTTPVESSSFATETN